MALSAYPGVHRDDRASKVMKALKIGANMTNKSIRKYVIVLLSAGLFSFLNAVVWGGTKTTASESSTAAIPAPGSRTPLLAENKVITESDCTAAKLGAAIPTSAIGEPVSGVTLSAPVWTGGTNSATAYCSVKGAMAPVDANAKPINFQVVLPASWSRRAAQMGGAGINGTIPNLLGGVDMGPGPSLVQNGFATYGSDSGHQMAFGFGFGGGMFGGPGGAASTGSGDDWALNDEAMKNLGYMQLKKTHDAAIVLMERIYGEKPRFSYFFGSSQGGREALTVAQRYPADYDGISANVPIVSFSSLMLAPELIRILVLRTDDGKYLYLRNAGSAADRSDVRLVPDFEAPNTSSYKWLNTGKYAGRRVLDLAAKTMKISVYDVSGVAATPDAANSVRVTKPADVQDQPWDYRKAAVAEKKGDQVINENVTLGASQSVGATKKGNRNIIPITGGTISGKITGKVLAGGADYQNLSNPMTIDARYLWQTSDGEVIIVRNGGTMGLLAPAFEVRVDSKYAWLNKGVYLSSNPGMGSGCVGLTFYESKQ
jgi:hypothetical protein